MAIESGVIVGGQGNIVEIRPELIIRDGLETPKANAYYLTDDGSTGSFEWNGKTVDVKEMKLIHLKEDEDAVITDLTVGALYRLKNGDLNYRVLATRLILESGGEFFINHYVRGVYNRIPAGLPIGQYAVRNVSQTGGAYGCFGKNADGELFEIPFQAGAQFFNNANGRRMLFTGDNIITIDEPFDVRTVVTKNVNLTTATKADLYAAMDLLDGKEPLRSASDRIKLRAILAGQTNQVENGYYEIELDTDIRDFQRLVPLEHNRLSSDLLVSMRVDRGDIYGSSLVAFKNKELQLSAGNVGIFRVGTNELVLEKLTPNQAQITSIEERIKKLEDLPADDDSGLDARITKLETKSVDLSPLINRLVALEADTDNIVRSKATPDTQEAWNWWIQEVGDSKRVWTWFADGDGVKYPALIYDAEVEGESASATLPTVTMVLPTDTKQMPDEMDLNLSITNPEKIKNIRVEVKFKGAEPQVFNVIPGDSTNKRVTARLTDVGVWEAAAFVDVIDENITDFALKPIEFTVIAPDPGVEYTYTDNGLTIRAQPWFGKEQIAVIADDKLTIYIASGKSTNTTHIYFTPATKSFELETVGVISGFLQNGLSAEATLTNPSPEGVFELSSDNNHVVRFSGDGTAQIGFASAAYVMALNLTAKAGGAQIIIKGLK